MVNNAPTRSAETQALDDAATTAGSAPSILNTQPWHWRLHRDALDLSVDTDRTLQITDPAGRLAILSCGVALHHALVSLAAGGWHATVIRLPASAAPGHLATVRVDGRIPIEPAAVRHLRAIGLRHTDRRSIPGVQIDADKLRSIAAAAQSHGASLRLLRPAQVFALAAAMDQAQRAETSASWQTELQYWTGGVRRLDTGLPGSVVPSGATPTTVISRDFGHPSAMLSAEAHSRTGVFAILHGPEDRPQDWLRAGEALSAAWLKATELEVSVLPLSATIEVPTIRDHLRDLLDEPGYPFLVLRFSVLNPAGPAAPRTPRLPPEMTVERMTD